MYRGRLKRRIDSCEKFGKEDDGRGNVELKKICHLTGIQITDHEIAKVKTYQLAADEYENYLVQENSISASFSPNAKCDNAANLCGSPLQSNRKLRNLDYFEFVSSPKLPKTGEQDDTIDLLNGTRQSSKHDVDNVSKLPAVPFVTEQQRTYDECAVNEFCQICKKDISCCNEEQRQQHINRCIDEVENAEQEKKHLENTEILWTHQVLNCPICWIKLKTQHARHLHLKKCAARFCISPMDLIELIRKQEEDHQIQLPSNSLQDPSKELRTAKRKPGLAKKKRSRAVKNRFEEPHSKLEEDTHLAIALSTSIEDRRKSLADFISYTQPVVNKPREEVTESRLIDATINRPLHHSSKDAFVLLMSQKTKESSLSTMCGKKNKQPSALLALDQDEVKRRLAEKATALVLKKTNISAFCDAEIPIFPESKLSARYCHKRSKDFLWCLATRNTEQLRNYYVKEFAHPMVLGDAGYLSLQQKQFNLQVPDERPEPLLLDPTVTSVLYGSTQTAFVLAELAAEAGTDTSFADDFSQKSLCNYQDMQKNRSPSEVAAKGFYLPTDEVCEKASTDLLNAWSQMVDNDCMSDLTVDCRDGEVIRLHRLVIMARYPNLLQVLESESSTKVFSQFSKMAALSVVRFIYSADTDVCHAVVFEAKELAESLQFTEFCKICENVVKAYNLIEPTAVEASSATMEALVTCNWANGSDLIQRDEEDSCGDSGRAGEKEEEEVGDADLDEVYAFMLTQRRDQMNSDEIDEDNESDTLKRNLEDDDDSQRMTLPRSCSRSDDEDAMVLELSHVVSLSEKLTKVISSEKSHEVMMGHVSCDSALTSEECFTFGAKAFPEEILSKKKACSSVHVESSDGKVQHRSNSFLIDHVSKNSNRAIDLVAMKDEADGCLSENDDDEKNVPSQKSGEEFAPEYSAGVELYHGKDDSRGTACLEGGSCVSIDILKTIDVTEHPLDSTDVCAVDSFDASQHGGKELMVPYRMISQPKSASSSSCSSAQWSVSSSGFACDSTEAISKHPSGLVSTCMLSSDSLSPDLFPSSPCSESLLSSVVSVHEPSVLLQASMKLKNVLDTDEVFRGVLETNESTFDDGRNLSTGGSGRGIERQSAAKWENYGHTAPTFKKNSDKSVYLENNILETNFHSQVDSYCFCQDNHIDAELHFLSQMSEKLTAENVLPDLDGDDVKVQNAAERTCGLSLTSTFLNCSEDQMKNNHMRNNDIEDVMCIDKILFPHGVRTLNLPPDVRIFTRSTNTNETFPNCLVLPSNASLSSSSCRINSPVVMDEVENGFQMSVDETSKEIQVVEMSDKEYCQKKRRRFGADCAANDAYDDRNATQRIPVQCDDEVSAAVLDSDERICDEENIWEMFPEEEFISHVSFENERNTSHTRLASRTPESVKRQGQSTSGNINYSPPTDMETDVSALMEDVIANSSLLYLDASFETSDGPSRTVINAKLPVVNMAKQVNYEFGGTPITPLPSYGQMNTPVLQQRCNDYGIRRLPKKQMVGVLQNIFFELHPGIPKPEKVNPKQHANKRTKAVRNRGNVASFLANKISDGHIAHQQDNSNIRMTGHPAAFMTSGELCEGRTAATKQTTAEILKCSDSESDNYLDSENPKQNFGNYEDEEENSLEYVADESLLVQNEKKTKSKQDDCLKKEMLVSFFAKSTDLYQRILNYEPLELDYLKKLLKEKEIKVTSHSLIDFLDEQNILYTTRNNRATCSSRRLPVKGKVTSRPTSRNKNNVFIIG